MKYKEISMNLITVKYALLIMLLTGGLYAEQIMSPEQTEALILQLTDTPRSCWIHQGMIRARHMEYYEFDNSMKETTETVYRDGIRFRLEMHMEDGMSTAEVSSQQPLNQFQQDFKLNRNRTFLWDGNKYIQYYQSANYAVVALDSDQDSHELSGPATAGIIPWGYGDYTFLVLMSQEPTATITYEAGHEKVLLEYVSKNIPLQTIVSFMLDPSKNYALSSYSIENEQALMRHTYMDYQQSGDEWIPSKILIERFDKRSGFPRLISYEDWQFEAVDTTVPSDEKFNLSFENGTMVELQAADGLKTFLYNASDRVDISSLLEDKIALLQIPDTVNCATAAIQHIAKQFSKEISPSELAGLVSSENKQTSLADMKQTLEQTGLTCMAVETNLETLEQMTDCVTVLYLSFSNHYVVLDHIDEDGVWLIDLTDRKFYANHTIDEFLTEWNSGVALLVSDEPILPPLDATFRYLEAHETADIFGGGDFGKYSCTDPIQNVLEIEHAQCPDPIGGIMCYGAYYVFFMRYGCIEDESGGTCSGQKMLSYVYYPCCNNPTKEGACTARVDRAVSRYIRACE